MRDIGRITYASDFSPASLVALPHALRLARIARADLTIVHVLPSPRALFIEGGYVPQEVWDQTRADAAKEMDRLVQQAVNAGVRATATIVDEGSAVPADAIVRAAEDAKTDVLVLGTHGRTGVTRLILGSVAARVVATASCPVLTVRAGETGESRS
jgi:nucleotide-binding universal stress UspA family protein